MKYDSYYEKMAGQPILSLLVELSIPTVISMLVTNIYNMADTAFVGQLGTSASGAVGVVFGFMSIIQAIGFMFGQGCGSILSRKLGQQDRDAASEVASTGFFWVLVMGFILAACGYLFLDPLVFMLGSTDTIAPYAKTYISYILLACPFMVATFCMNNILRYEGKAFLGMIGMLSGAVLNICLDPVFMFVFDMGIAGAGLATCLSQYISFFILLSMFLGGRTQCRLSFGKVNFRLSFAADIAGTGCPSLLRQVLNSTATIVLNQQAAIYGDAAVAAMSIVSRVVFFVFAMALGIGQGFQPICGFSFGAGRYKRLKEAFRTTVILAETVLIAIDLCVLLNVDSVIRIFRDDTEVVKIGTRALRLQLLTQVFLPVCTAVEMLHQSTGKKLGASILSSLRSGLFFIPAVILLARLRGLAGIQEAQPLAFVLALFPAVWMGWRYFKKLPD